MIFLLHILAACSTPVDSDGDSAACESLDLATYSAAYTEAYCTWMETCPDYDQPYDLCEALISLGMESVQENYLPCAASVCLETLAAGAPTCQSNGSEWLDITECRYGTVFPGETR